MSTEVKLNFNQSRGYENYDLELIKVETNEQGQKLVSARELHEVLESKERFSKWFERMVGYGFILNNDFTPYQKVHPQNKQLIDDYVVTLEMAKHIAMVQRTEIGMRLRNYFIECEKVVRDPYAHLSKELQAIIKVDIKQQQLERRVDEIEENAYLSPSEYGLVSDAVSSRIRVIKQERCLALTRQQNSELFKALNGDIKKITGVRQRTQLRQKHLDLVLDFIRDWQPSRATMININQMSLAI